MYIQDEQEIRYPFPKDVRMRSIDPNETIYSIKFFLCASVCKIEKVKVLSCFIITEMGYRWNFRSRMIFATYFPFHYFTFEIRKKQKCYDNINISNLIRKNMITFRSITN